MGWLYLYFSAGLIFILLGIFTLLAGLLVYFGWQSLEKRKVLKLGPDD
jgi:hypothetical protein